MKLGYQTIVSSLSDSGDTGGGWRRAGCADATIVGNRPIEWNGCEGMVTRGLTPSERLKALVIK
jgi:hypothetical protein